VIQHGTDPGFEPGTSRNVKRTKQPDLQSMTASGAGLFRGGRGQFLELPSVPLAKEPDEDQDESNEEQQVDEVAATAAKEAEQPQDHEDDNDQLQHEVCALRLN